MIKLMRCAILALLWTAAPALATQQAVNVGSSANDGSGDPLRAAFTKLNANDAELYASVATLTTALGGRQPLDATLTGLAGVATAADKVIYATGTDAFATSDLTAFGRALIGSAGASAAKTLLTLAVADVTGAAPLASPTFTGTPAAPTAATGTSTTQIATTAFAATEIGARAVRYDAAQSLTAPQKTQARSNVGLAAPTISKFTASGTFTSPSDTLSTTVFKVTVTGGGAGGTAGSANNVTGTGGGAGGSAISYVSGFSASTGYAVTVGTGGAAGASGTASTFVGPSLTYTGGAGQVTTGAQGGLGGSATNGDVNLTGGSGGPVSSGTVNWSPAGGGGASMWGGGGAGASSTGASVVAGVAGQAPGSGGGGGSATASAAGAGAAGASGIVVVERLN